MFVQKKLPEELKRRVNDLIERMSKISLKDRYRLKYYIEIDKMRSEIREYVNMDFVKASDELIKKVKELEDDDKDFSCELLPKLTLQFDLESYSYLRKLDELLTKE